MTLNQIIAEIKGYFNNHSFIKSVDVTIDDNDYNALVDLSYPNVNIQYQDTGITDTQLEYNFKVVIADSYNPNIILHDIEIYSDTIQIVDDFKGWLEEQYEFDGIITSNSQPFTDSNLSRVSGHLFYLRVAVQRKLQSDCIAPHKN